MTSQFPLEALEQSLGNLTGLNKWVAKKILKGGFIEKIKKTLNSDNANEISNVIKKLVDTAAQQAAIAVAAKISFVLTIIAGLFALLAVIVTLVLGGNIIIPIAAFAVLIVMIWFVTGSISRTIARRVSGVVFKTIEGKISQFAANVVDK
ncbi:MAG: hypothetical protein FWD31_10710 [Planctomycetaceae bacterium]|nr:hypothetical protein [Planctomycetaceae bacterium]